MNYEGDDVVKSIAKRLNNVGIPPTDSNIIKQIKKLNKYELAELINFGSLAKWIRDERSNGSRI